VIVVAAMSLTLALMMLYDGLIAGFEQAIYGNAVKILGGNVQVHAAGYRMRTASDPLLPLPDDAAVVEAAVAQPHAVAASRRIDTGGLVTSRAGAFAVSIVGIEPAREEPVSLAAQNVVAGRYLAGQDEDQAFIGQGLARAMDVEVGDRFTLAGGTSHGQTRQRTMTVVGIYDLGLEEIEKRTVYISLAEAQRLFDLPGQSTEVVIFLEALGQEDDVIEALNATLTGVEIDPWKTSFPDLERTLGTKNAVMNVFSVVVQLAAGIGILNLLLMAVYERTREIGVLGALGMRPRQISLLFAFEGVIIGLVGVVVGVVLGLLMNAVLGRVGLDYTAFANLTSYMALVSERVYPTLGIERLPERALTVALIAVLASLYPAYQASRREPAEALHYV
jgi:ABC-type lipoprotein release transport system permease subunit